jgi:hypothetical protein
VVSGGLSPGLSSGPGSGQDPRALLEGLAERIPTVLPEGVADAVLEVEWDRSMGDRLAGRPGTVAGVRLRGPEWVLALRLHGRRLLAEAQREVRGVVIARQTPPLAAWLDLLAGQLHALVTEAAGNAAAVSRALAALGVAEPGSDLIVEPADVAGGLRQLPLRLVGRVPDDVVVAVQRIADLLVDTLPRVAGSFDQEQAVLRTATDYLPATLQAYAALPPEWATTHQLPAGGTPLAALQAQLSVLESAVTRMREAAVTADASALLANGAFLADRFAVSSLDVDRPQA